MGEVLTIEIANKTQSARNEMKIDKSPSVKRSVSPIFPDARSFPLSFKGNVSRKAGIPMEAAK